MGTWLNASLETHTCMTSTGTQVPPTSLLSLSEKLKMVCVCVYRYVCVYI